MSVCGNSYSVNDSEGNQVKVDHFLQLAWTCRTMTLTNWFGFFVLLFLVRTPVVLVFFTDYFPLFYLSSAASCGHSSFTLFFFFHSWFSLLTLSNYSFISLIHFFLTVLIFGLSGKLSYGN